MSNLIETLEQVYVWLKMYFHESMHILNVIWSADSCKIQQSKNGKDNYIEYLNKRALIEQAIITIYKIFESKSKEKLYNYYWLINTITSQNPNYDRITELADKPPIVSISGTQYRIMILADSRDCGLYFRTRGQYALYMKHAKEFDRYKQLMYSRIHCNFKVLDLIDEVYFLKNFIKKHKKEITSVDDIRCQIVGHVDFEKIQLLMTESIENLDIVDKLDKQLYKTYATIREMNGVSLRNIMFTIAQLLAIVFTWLAIQLGYMQNALDKHEDHTKFIGMTELDYRFIGVNIDNDDVDIIDLRSLDRLQI